MFGLFKRKSSLLSERISEKITIAGDKQILIKLTNGFHEWACQHPEVLFDDHDYDKQKEILKTFIDKEIRQIGPFINYNHIEKKFALSIYLNTPKEIPELSFEWIDLEIHYLPNAIQIDEVFQLQDIPYISRFRDNYDYKLRQDTLDKLYYLQDMDTDIHNKLLYPEIVVKNDYYDNSYNPGKISGPLKNLGKMSVSFENYYSSDLLEAIGKNKVKNALQTMGIEPKQIGQYLYFKLFDDHRRSEYNENLKKIYQYKKLIGYDNFIETYKS